MTNEDDGAILPGDDPTGRIYVRRQRSQRVLYSDNVKASCFEDWNDFGPTRTVRKRPVNEDDILHGWVLLLWLRAAREHSGNSDKGREQGFGEIRHRILFTKLVMGC
jgi:hypothetical protein